MKVIVTGSHGFIGTALAARLQQRGDDVTCLVRQSPGPGEAHWDPASGAIDAAALDGHDAVVHLAGAGIGDKRWSPGRKEEVLRSRVDGTTLLAETLAKLARPPRVLASGSAVGYYGDRGDEVLTEDSSAGDGFLADVARQWEAAAAPAQDAGIRVAYLRTGIVLSPSGGALQRLLLPFKLGLGGRVGSGRQWMSWISLDDELDAIVHVLEHDDVKGPVNLTAPEPVTNAELTKALGRALHRPTAIPTPTFALKAVLGSEAVEEMLLGGQRVLPARLESSAFSFRHRTIDAALGAIL